MKLTTNGQVDSRNNGPASTESARARKDGPDQIAIRDGNHRVSAGELNLNCAPHPPMEWSDRVPTAPAIEAGEGH
jgi:hypothetical protein